MIAAVIDTNVLVAALMSKHPDSATRRTLMAVADGKAVVLIAPEILAEYRDVLHRDYLKISEDEADRVIELFVRLGKPMSPVHADDVMPDEDDRVFYEVALAGAADNARLVTGNLKHYPVSPIVVTPAEFCSMLGV